MFKVFNITYHERSHIIYFFALPATCFYYCIYRRTFYLECRTGSSGRLGDWHSLTINIVITILTNRCWVHDIIFLFLARPQSKKFIWLVFGCLYVRLSLCLCMLTVISLLNALDACAAMKYSVHHGYIYIYRCHFYFHRIVCPSTSMLHIILVGHKFLRILSGKLASSKFRG